MSVVNDRYGKYIKSREIINLKNPVSPDLVIFMLTMDRFSYTQIAIESIVSNSELNFVMIIVDQNSSDGTVDRLLSGDYSFDGVLFSMDRNIGISAGNNLSIIAARELFPNAKYLCKVDNDCEIMTEGWDVVLSEVIDRLDGKAVLSPYVEGLRENKGGVTRYAHSSIKTSKGVVTLGLTQHIGGICRLSTFDAYDGFEFDESDTLSGNQDLSFSMYSTMSKGKIMGYIEEVRCRHIDTTDGQHAKYPEYFERRANYDRKVSFNDIK